MVGHMSPVLPGELWGPDLHFKNNIDEVDKDYEQFTLADYREGRLKRIINYTATIAAPMKLRRFPFDVQCITAELLSISHWSTEDRTRAGSLASGQSYTLQPIVRTREGRFLFLLWDGRVSEWELHSYDVKLRRSQNREAGFVATSARISFHCVRKYEYYLCKIFAPLFMLTLASFVLQLIPISSDSGLSDRIQASFTMFLAAFTLLYVTSSDVPKVNHVTNIDLCIFLSLGVLLWLAVESAVIDWLWRDYGFRGSLTSGGAQAADRLCGVVAFFAYLVGLWYTIGPALLDQASLVHKLDELNDDDGECVSECVRACVSERVSA